MQGGIVAGLIVDEHEPAHAPAGHVHGHGAGTFERFGMLFLTDPKHEPPDTVLAAVGAAEHVAVQKEADPAHHPLFGRFADAGQGFAHAVGEILVIGHSSISASSVGLANPNMPLPT